MNFNLSTPNFRYAYIDQKLDLSKPKIQAARLSNFILFPFLTPPIVTFYPSHKDFF